MTKMPPGVPAYASGSSSHELPRLPCNRGELEADKKSESQKICTEDDDVDPRKGICDPYSEPEFKKIS